MGRKEIEGISRFLKKVKKRFNPEKIILFGSRARGDWLQESDFDLIIVSEKFKNYDFHRRIAEVLKLQDEAVGIDVICLTPAEFKEKSRQICIVREAVKEGVEIEV